MCDWSLNACKTRDAQVDDQLTSGPILLASGGGYSTSTRGFHETNTPDLAICLRPGTELAFSEAVKYARVEHGVVFDATSRYSTAVFREVDTHNPHVHHDSLEFPDGSKVLVHCLVQGQSARVLQLGVDPKVAKAEGQPQAYWTEGFHPIDPVPAPIQEPAPTEPEPLKA